jgi:hypothetical protein
MHQSEDSYTLLMSFCSKNCNQRHQLTSSAEAFTCTSFRCRQLGVQVHISKPIKRFVLVRALHLTLGILDAQTVSQGKAVNEKAQGPGKGLHILVAEDNIVNQRVAVTLLQKWGHSTVLACNGAEAVEKSVEGNFDLILMDVCTSSSILTLIIVQSVWILPSLPFEGVLAGSMVTLNGSYTLSDQHTFQFCHQPQVVLLIILL